MGLCINGECRNADPGLAAVTVKLRLRVLLTIEILENSVASKPVAGKRSQVAGGYHGTKAGGYWCGVVQASASQLRLPAGGRKTKL